MFCFKKKNLNEECTSLAASKSKNKAVKKILAVALCLSMIPNQIYFASAAEGGDIGGIASSGVSVVTSVMGSIWGFITGNEYLSFSVAVSVILAVVMIFKRLIGAARR